MAAVPSIGRASQIEGARVAPEASATQALYERYAGQIFGYCLHQLGSREEAEDAVQQTFLNAFRGLSRGVVPEMEQAWIFKIANNVCLSRRRSSWRRGRIESPEDFQEMQDSLPAPTRGGGVADELVGLQDVLEEMPENQRRAILLREWQGLSYREIADEMDLSQAAVETLIFRARRSLAQGLAEPPKKTWRKSARRGIDLGGVIGAVKTLFTGGAAVKLGAAVVAVTAATVAATTPPPEHHYLRVPQRVTAAPAATAPAHADARVDAPVVARELHVAHAAAPVVAASARVERTHTSRPAIAKQKPSTSSSTPVDAKPDTSTPTPAASAPTTPAPAPAPAPAPVVQQHPQAPAPAAHEPSHGNGNANGNGHKSAPAPAPTPSTQSAAPSGHGNAYGHESGGGHGNAGTHGNGNGHGNAHVADPRVPAVATPSPAPQSAPAPQPTATASPASAPAPAPAADAAHGNGGDHGNGKGAGKSGK